MNVYAKVLLLGIILLLFVAGLTIFLFPPLLGLFRYQNYLLQSEVKKGWITIEYENPSCPQIPTAVFNQDIEIPSSGYLCASTSQYSGWHQPRYYLVLPDGSREAINGDEIRAISSFQRAKGQTNDGKEYCAWKGEQFFYGTAKEFVEENPVEQNASFLAYHPDCRDGD